MKTLKTYHILLSNHVDSQDDEVMTIKAHDMDEAIAKARPKINFNRFSIRCVRLLPKKRKKK